MTDKYLYIHLHGDFHAPDQQQKGWPRQFSTCQTLYKGMDDSYSELCYAMIETLKQSTDLLGDREKLERVIFYSTTSAPQVVPGNMLLWLLGAAPHPENKDPQWMS